MFWTVRADCSPSLPTSGPAIVARAKWMGSEPEIVLNKAALVSNKRLEGIQNHTAFTAGGRVTNNKHFCVGVTHVHRNDSGHTHTQSNPPLPLQKWRAARLDCCPVGVVSSNRISWGRERAWRHASLPPCAVIIKIHYTLKMELLEPNCCRLNYLENTLQHILIICS